MSVPETLLRSFQNNWRLYLMEAWALGTFMVVAAVLVVVLEHPAFFGRNALDQAFVRRVLLGLAIGSTAVFLIKSDWGKRSGAHMNPAVTLTFYQLDRISLADAFWYIIAQFAGAYTALAGLRCWMDPYLASPTVQYIATVPGPQGPWLAFGLEMLMAFVLFSSVLLTSNSARWAPYTPYLVGLWLLLFISLEAPYSGMSLNPARTFASSAHAGIWTAWWIYVVAPIVGMQLAGALYRRGYRLRHNGNCLTMKCHLSGEKHDCPTYEVLGPFHKGINLKP